MSKKMKILFTVSVLLNVLLGAAYGGMMINRHHDSPWQQEATELSEETREKVRESFKDARNDFKKHKQSVEQVRGEIDEILAREEFDRAAYLDAAQRMRNVFGDMMARKIDKIADLLEETPAEERPALARQLMRPFCKKGGRDNNTEAAPQQDQ